MKHFSCAGLWRARAALRRCPSPRSRWGQHNASEPASTVALHFHHSLGTIGIGGHNNPSFGGEVKIPEFVTSRQRCHEQLFRVPTGAVSPKGWIGGAVNDGLAFRADLVIAGIVAISRGAAAEITASIERNRIPMIARSCHVGPP